jgi:hypothetical protein
LSIKKDPRLDTTDSEFKAQLDLLLKIQQRIAEIQTSVRILRDVREQVERLAERLESADPANEVALRARSVSAKLTGIEESLVPTEADYDRADLAYPPRLSEQLNHLYRYVGATDDRPTDAAYVRLADLEPELERELDQFRAYLDTELTSLNDEAAHAGARPVVIPPPPTPRGVNP